jgi:hypothetical protein
MSTDVVHLRETGDDGREHYAGSIGKSTLVGPTPAHQHIAITAPGHQVQHVDLDAVRLAADIETAQTNPAAFIGHPIPVTVATHTRFAGDDIEAEFAIDGTFVSITRNAAREATFDTATHIQFEDTTGEHYVTITDAGEREEYHLVNYGPVVLAEDDTDGLAETLDVLSVDAEGDASSATTFATLDRFSETGEVGLIALTDAIGHLISIREDIEDGYDLGIWSQYQRSLNEGLHTLITALPLHVVEAVAQEYRGLSPKQVNAALADGIDPWA